MPGLARRAILLACWWAEQGTGIALALADESYGWRRGGVPLALGRRVGFAVGLGVRLGLGSRRELLVGVDRSGPRRRGRCRAGGTRRIGGGQSREIVTRIPRDVT